MSSKGENRTLCLQCGSEMSSRAEDVDYEWAGMRVLLGGVQVRRCPKCGEREIVIQKAQRLHRAIAEHLAHKEERLLPIEIRFLRKWMGLSNVDFASRMGVTQETSSRWQSAESPAQMDRPAERLLRMLVLRGEPQTNYDLDGIESMATKKPKATKLKATPSDAGWRLVAA